MSITSDSWLSIYLNDHLAGAAAGVELARRAGRQHGHHQESLREISTEIERDRQALLSIMRAIDVPVRKYKHYLGWVAEKLGRLKLNDRLFSRSPVSDVLELEALTLAVEGKAAGWRLLRQLADHDDRLDSIVLDELLDRARSQSRTLEALRVETARVTFTDPTRLIRH